MYLMSAFQTSNCTEVILDQALQSRTLPRSLLTVDDYGVHEQVDNVEVGLHADATSCIDDCLDHSLIQFVVDDDDDDDRFHAHCIDDSVMGSKAFPVFALKKSEKKCYVPQRWQHPHQGHHCHPES